MSVDSPSGSTDNALFNGQRTICPALQRWREEVGRGELGSRYVVIAAPVGWEGVDGNVQHSIRKYIQPYLSPEKVFVINKFLSISRCHT
jgi:hypothetical protein